ncbi:MAG: hypothetical protein ACLGHL_00020 [Actinomycetota bacterium]
MTQRASVPTVPQDTITRILGKPVAYLLTTAVLLALFGWTFVANPDRVAPTKDPAYYTWRTEALINEDPETLLNIEGAFGMFEGGYRIYAPVVGGFLREAAGISTLRVTVVMMTVLPVLIALLLAGFAYRQRRDPLIWHSVALGAGSLLLTPPFVGYLDNVLCLVFLAASLYFIPTAKNSWPSRVAFFLFLLGAGFTHPTTLVIFCVVLGGMAAARLLFRRFDLRSVITDDGPMLLTAFAAAVTTVAVWTVGIWGKSASLSESALSPPYGSDFFVDRLVLWVKAMTPALNVPLFVIGLVGLLVATKKRAAEDDLTRVSIVWLAPLVGIFGFLAGAAYPYYRFFNTTLAWVLLVGIGMWLAARFFIDAARGGGARNLALVGLVGLLAIVYSNFTKGFDLSGWNNAGGGWISASQRTQMDNLRAELERSGDGRPVVFVVDDEPDQEFQIWGFTKLSGNTSRYGMPTDQIENAYMYLGSLDNLLLGEPTLRGEETYDRVSRGTLEDAREGIDASGKDPIVVVAQAFNPAGANTDYAETGNPPVTLNTEVWTVSEDGTVTVNTEGSSESFMPGGLSLPGNDPSSGGPLDIVWALLGLAALLIPGYLALRWVLPGADLAEGLGMVPALSITVLSLTGTIVIAVTRSAFSAPLVWASVILAAVVMALLGRRSTAARALPAQP